MDIGSLGGVANVYNYANQIRNKQVASPSFANSLKEATSTDSRVEEYKKACKVNLDVRLPWPVSEKIRIVWIDLPEELQGRGMLRLHLIY